MFAGKQANQSHARDSSSSSKYRCYWHEALLTQRHFSPSFCKSRERGLLGHLGEL